VRLCAEESRRLADAHSDAVREAEASLRGRGNRAAPEARIHLADHYHALSHHKKVKKILAPLFAADGVDELWRARALARLGWAELFLGDLDHALNQFNASIAILKPTHHHSDLSFALRGLGTVRQAQGQLHEAIEFLHGALAASQRGDRQTEVARCFASLGMAVRMRGDYLFSIELHERCLAECASEETREMQGRAHLNVAVPRFLIGDFEGAEQAVKCAFRIFEETACARGVGLASVLFSRLARYRNNVREGHQFADVALKIGQESQYMRLEVLALEEKSDCLTMEGNDLAAAKMLGDALTRAKKLAPKGDLAYEVLWRLSRACRAIGHIGRARALAEQAVELTSTAADARERALALLTLAMVRHDIGSAAEARDLVQETIEVFRKLGAAFDLAQAHEIAATFALDGEDDGRTAIAHLHEAARLYARTGVGHAATAAEERLRSVEASAGFPSVPAAVADGTPGTVIAVSRAMRDVIAMARMLADYDNTTLIEGPTGCGKEVIARMIHSSGAWADREFCPLNCASLPKHLLESELFGHRRGAFTGAESDRVGHLEAAGDGIVFLDEIDKTDKVFQAKLLRVLEDRKFIAVGETETRDFRARILCASNRGLRLLADTGAFLPDLYYRLAAGRIAIPPLHERPEDTEALAELFLDQSAERYGSRRLAISRGARVALLTYSWPGNVRELKNVIELAAFMARGEKELKPEHLPTEVAQALERGGQRTLASHIEEVERREIDLALRKTDGSRTDSAKLLGISRKGMLDKLRRLRIEDW
ncbi:MAG: sigma 54-interacting transcriptional regulator, partial [Phycisphaerales bacterium]|nr:sigma 54-interacting transcriptional regulator [Phycisphaerales bacterium]